jgi:hypothetical protein
MKSDITEAKKEHPLCQLSVGLQIGQLGFHSHRGVLGCFQGRRVHVRVTVFAVLARLTF